jgi:hypothetical protein
MKSQGNSKKNSFVQEKMKYADTFTSKFKEELLKSDSFNYRHKKTLNYGRPKQLAKHKTSNSILSINPDEAKMSINIENYEKIDLFNKIELIKKSIFENKKFPNISTISLNDNLQQLPLIEDPRNSINKFRYEKECFKDSNFVIQNFGNVSNKNILKKLQIEADSGGDSQQELKIELINGNYVYSLKKKKTIFSKEIQPRYTIISNQKAKDSKLPDQNLQLFSQNKKPRTKFVSTCDKKRDKALLYDLKTSVESLEKIQGNINKTLNNAYEGLLNREYEKVNEKVKKLMRHHLNVSDVLNNKLFDKKKKTMMLSLLHKK